MSANTILLHVFRTLAIHGRSFSVGDLALEDVTGAFDALLLGMPRGSELEHELQYPLDDQCPCDACRAASVPKLAIRFQHAGPNYVRIQPQPHLSISPSGLLLSLFAALGAPPVHAVVRNCHNRSIARVPYSHGAYDCDTYARICRDVPAALAEWERYNRLRVGNEFFVPSEVVRGASASTV
jgi:hypothetical protein